ncbi:hypothetical protein FPV67DRAFT_995278 [Lyophyllum atratum]|nr:hypothetical protein FPV67DRAFT_995278 [Lyophyllum atratum]
MSKKRHREDEEYVAWSSPLPHSSPQPESVSPKLKHPRAKITEGVPTSRPERKSMLATRPRRDSAPSSRPSQPPAILKNRGPSPFPALVSDPVESVYLPQGNGDRKDKGKGKECDLNYLGRRRSIADPEADIPGSSRLDLGASSRLSRRSYGSLPNRRIKRSSPFMPSSPMSRRSTFSTPPPESSEFRRLSRRSYASLSSRSATHPSTPTPTPARSRTSTFSTPGPRLESSVIPSPTRALPFPIAPEDRDTVHYLGVCASLTAIAERFGFREVGVWRVWEALGSVARTEEFCRRCWEEGGGEGGVSVDGDVCALLGVGVLGAECGNKSGRTGATRIVRSSFAPTGAEIDVKEEEDEDDNMCRLRLRLGGHASGE